MVIILNTIAIPIAIYSIFINYERALYLLLLAAMLPGYVSAIQFLKGK